jgi:chromosome partitioning protein
MKVVTFSIFKGGTAKTTSTVNTAAALAKKGKKVLVIDLDQQASATRYLDLDPDASPNLYEVFMGNRQAALAIRKTKLGIDVLSSHVLMAAIEEALEPGDETKLTDLIMPLRGLYDFILIGTPPGKAMLAFNGLAAADLIVIPASAERMAVDGVADLINHVQRIMWNKFNLNHQELRILFTMYRSTTTPIPRRLLRMPGRSGGRTYYPCKSPTPRFSPAPTMRRSREARLMPGTRAPLPTMS